MTNLPDQSQFQQIFNGLADRYPAIRNTDGRSTAFQMSAGPLQAHWKTGADFSAHEMANAVSQSLGRFYTPSAGELAGAYGDLIMSIKPANYTDNSQYISQMKQLDDLRAARQSTIDAMQVAWATYVEQNTGADGTVPQTSTAWRQDVLGGLEFTQHLNDIGSEIDRSNQKLTAVVGSMDAALARAQAAYGDKSNFAKYKTPDGAIVDRRRAELDGDLASDMTNWDNYGADDWDFHTTLKGHSTSTSPWRTVRKVEVEHHCLSTNVRSSTNTSRIVRDEHYKLDLYFKGLQAYKVQLGRWFDPSYVNPKTAVFSPGATVASDTFFGANGSLHMIPDTIWIAYRPKIVITVSTEVFEQQFVRQAESGVGWFDLFSLRFKVEGAASLKPVPGAGGTMIVTFDKPVSANPQVLGVTSSVRYDGGQ